ncbi:4-azaleucine resistance probable transporter AzlC [Epibacterium ulvae]|uniref:4-azaleucine resistance probable transporter AzlC n=1 Tax=Epibacterium ulvae TaxID=1156985 RepID=A0A1G5RC91_9RHOB|nr:AzlC family ABC transporter permease [Epibacterium ulvae]SCZ71693.1 4-azaleucine resistance probable transporter AzlC [Epibacterium ulvae]
MSRDPWSDIVLGARDMMPMALAAATYGTAFGLLAIQSEFSLAQTISMSALVFGGSAQLVALDQLVAGAGVAAAVLAGAALNIRILLITASMRAALTHRPWWQVMAGVYVATDASVALMQTAKQRGTLASYHYLFGGGLLLLLVWIAATTLGALLSQGIPNPKTYGLDFAIVAVFVALLPGLWRGRQDLAPWGIAAATVAAGTALFPDHAAWALVCGAVCGAVVAGLRHDA